MTARKLTNVAQSVHQRLLNQAKSVHRPFSEFFQNYVTERFLYRLGVSPHRERFVLKGALMLRVWGVPQARPTTDIDLLGRKIFTRDEITSAIEECLSLEVPDDGIKFDRSSITADPIAEDKEHHGWRLRFRGRLGNARFVLQIDCGFGDVIVPGPVEIEYPALLDLPGPEILSYTIESTLAEKYQSMIVLDLANSRMKDFYDLWTLALGSKFDGERLSSAIKVRSADETHPYRARYHWRLRLRFTIIAQSNYSGGRSYEKGDSGLKILNSKRSHRHSKNFWCRQLWHWRSAEVFMAVGCLADRGRLMVLRKRDNG